MTIGEQIRVVVLSLAGGLAGMGYAVFKLKDESAAVPYGIGGLLIGAVVGILIVIASRKGPAGAA